jgi:hypothetical protein
MAEIHRRESRTDSRTQGGIAVIYLSSPYTDPELEVRAWRFCAACQAAAHLLRSGHLVFSPVAHTHPISLFGLPTEWEFWERQDRALLERCDRLVVLMLDGWRESLGVQAEIRIAAELGIPTEYWDPDEIGVTLGRVAKEDEP